jgi:CTP synthase
VKSAKNDRPKIKIALVGKYVQLEDAYYSVREAVNHASISLGVDAEISWVLSPKLEGEKKDAALWNEVTIANGIIVPGGFGGRGIEGKIEAARFARENKVPYFGLCLGMQLMVVEFARHLLGDGEANSSEFRENTAHPVIDLMLEQRGITDKGATMRLGLYPCVLEAGTIAAEAYGVDQIDERHRHRYELNNDYRDMLSEAGMRFSGVSPDDMLVEIAELCDHPFMLGTQFHPEFLSRPTRPHPLFVEFVAAACEIAGVKYKKD